MTQYLMAVHGSAEDYEKEFGGYASEAELKQAFADTDAFNKKLQESGNWVFGGGLESPTTATVVDNLADAPVVTDGPYLESKEYLGGFWVIEAPDLDAALALAAEASQACRGKVEVRPFQGEA